MAQIGKYIITLLIYRTISVFGQFVCNLIIGFAKCNLIGFSNFYRILLCALSKYACVKWLLCTPDVIFTTFFFLIYTYKNIILKLAPSNRTQIYVELKTLRTNIPIELFSLYSITLCLIIVLFHINNSLTYFL